MARRNGSSALKFWLVGAGMIIASTEWPYPFALLFWWGVLTLVAGFLIGMEKG